jgi:hypothetical protein
MADLWQIYGRFMADTHDLIRTIIQNKHVRDIEPIFMAVKSL